MALILASASPRRYELLQQLGILPEVLIVDLDESQHRGESWQAYVSRIAVEKAQVGFCRSAKKLPVLGADTTVIINDKILGKPTSTSEARTMLESLSAGSHQVVTAIAIRCPDGRLLQAQSVTVVEFAELPPEFIQSYVNSGEVMDKAGAYAIQGKVAAFISKISGSYSGVMGLPLFETAYLLKQAGVSWYGPKG